MKKKSVENMTKQELYVYARMLERSLKKERWHDLRKNPDDLPQDVQLKKRRDVRQRRRPQDLLPKKRRDVRQRRRPQDLLLRKRREGRQRRRPQDSQLRKRRDVRQRQRLQGSLMKALSHRYFLRNSLQKSPQLRFWKMKHLPQRHPQPKAG